MKLPWQPAPEELFALRGHGGQLFADFVSALIRAEAALSRLPVTDVSTSTRVNVADGGVDAEVRAPLGGPFELAFPTCWQFKAVQFSDFGESDLREEANKSEAKRLIEAGYAYYVCVCDDWPSKKMHELDSALQNLVREIDPGAPMPRVLNASHLAEWAGRHPAVVLRFFRSHIGQALTYEAWQRKECAVLPTFVELQVRGDATAKIRAFTTADQVGRPILTVRGSAGAGASRLVAETLSPVSDRVIYVTEPTIALALITSLVNQTGATAIVVLDRCTRDVRIGVEELLRAAADRLRALIIQDASDPSSDVTLPLPALEDADVQRVIEANFPDIPSGHRRAFVHFADGVLKIAAQLAMAYRTDRSRFLLDSAAWAHDELRRLVRDEGDWKVLRGISLFKRVGYRGDVSDQLELLCRVLGLGREDVVQRSSRLAKFPGVVVLGARYLSVRPRLFARPLFEAAWHLTAADDVNALMESLSPGLRLALVEQAAVQAPKEARDALADWAGPWVSSQRPEDLARSDVLERLLPLIEVCPTRFAATLSDLVERQSDDQARLLGERYDHWPARTHVIWTLRQLLERRETYFLAERALFRLARVESVGRASRQSSSATEAWAASFRLFLSGTEVAFSERLAILRAKSDTFGSVATPLVIIALGFALESHASRTEGMPVRSGELRVQDWQPRTYQELWGALDGAIALLGRCLLDTAHRNFAFKTLVEHGRGLLQSGRIDALRGALGSIAVTELERISVAGLVDEFLEFDVGSDEDKEESERYPLDYVQSVREWREILRCVDLRARVLEAVSLASYRHNFEDKDTFGNELRPLAVELRGARAEFENLLPFLVDGEHHGGAVFELGRSIGQIDSAGALVSVIVPRAAQAPIPLFFRGYIVGLAEQGTAHDAAVGAAIDALEDLNPAMAVDLNGMNTRIGSAPQRAIRLVRARQLPPTILAEVWSLRFEGELLAEALEAILDTQADRTDDAAGAALTILSPLAWDSKTPLPQDERTRLAIWRVLEYALAGARSEAHSWGRVLRRLSEVDLEQAVQLACSAATSADLSIAEEAASELSICVEKNSALVLSILGPMLLDRQKSGRFLVGRGGRLLNQFPPEAMIEWVRENGLDAARVIAPHMPAPYLDQDGNACVPPLTAFVLENFEDDDRIFWTFCSGNHSGQMYYGDIAGQHDKEAAIAEHFRTHALRRVREWAEQEERRARSQAQWWREHREEEFDE